MPSSKSVNPIKVGSNNQQTDTRLTRRSFSSTDSNNSPYDLDSIAENPVHNKEFEDTKKNKGILINYHQDDNQQQQQQQQHNNNNNNDKNVSWLKKQYDNYNPSLTLENKASVARDHLANERTFLAWLRTSLSFISIGVAITQLFRISRATGNSLNKYDNGGKQLGIVFVVLGIVFLAFGITRYFHSQHLMTKGHFPASRGSVVIGTILTILVLVACFIVIIN